MEDLGWANGWSKDPEIVTKCKQLGHKLSNVDKGNPRGRGLDNVVTCNICDYVYHYDST